MSTKYSVSTTDTSQIVEGFFPQNKKMKPMDMAPSPRDVYVYKCV